MRRRTCFLDNLKFSLAILCLASTPLRAQIVDVYTNYDERIGSHSTPTVQDGDEVFGARTNIATGGLSFSVPVLSIPGNNGLDISVTYKLGLRSIAGSTEWNFEEDEPYLSGSFSEAMGWVNSQGSNARCSSVNNVGYGPPKVPPTNGRAGWFYANEYWSGYFLSLPGGGGRLNKAGTGLSAIGPAEGGPYPWATNDFWFF